jgi:Zn-dependent protease
MGVVRHPFEAAPYVARAVRPAVALRGVGIRVVHAQALDPMATGAWLARERALSADDQVWLRGLRSETRALWVTTGGSALASVLVYALLWGMPMAIGLVVGMGVHELGHWWLIRRLGLQSSPIVFVPFVGAVQKLRSPPPSALAGAQLALAGPLCGLLFAAACKLAFLATGWPVLGLLGTAHALLALLDAVPFGMLDGRRIFAALNRRHRAACACACASLALLTQSLFLIPVCAVLAWTVAQPAPDRSPTWVAAVYMVLLAAGTLLV